MLNFTKILTLLAISVLPAAAVTVPLTLVPGATVGETLTFSADLGGLGLSQIGSIQITDDGTTTGGAPGVFSGFDVDALFLDLDGNLATTGDRIFPSSFVFQAGSTRPTTNPDRLPNLSHPGPTFGSLDANTIDSPTATLDAFDGVNVVDVDIADGFLTLGDAGQLIANFAPEIPVSGSLTFFIGEVGGQPGEGLSATVSASDTVIPEPSALLMVGSALAGLLYVRRRKAD